MKRLKTLLFVFILCCSHTLIQGQNNVTTFAGNGSQGYLNGNKNKAEFSAPYCLCFDSAGNLYISDTHNERIRKINTSGNISSIAGNGTSGYYDATGSSAEFYNPKGICIDKLGNLYVVDAINYLIRKITPGGKVTTLASFPKTTYSGVDICIDTSGNLYLADNGSNQVQKINISTGKLTTFAGNGTAGTVDGNATSAEFNGPNGICIDKFQNIYTVDLWSNVVRKISPKGYVTTIAGTGVSGSTNGNISSASFNAPHSIIIDDATGLFYVSENGNNDIRVIDTINGTVSTVAGNYTKSGYLDSIGSQALLSGPRGMALYHTDLGKCDDSTYLYFADINNYVVRRILISIPLIGSSQHLNSCSNTNITIGNPSIKGYSYTWSTSANINDSTIAQPTFQYNNNSGTINTFDYYVIKTNGLCSYTDSFKINILPNPTKPRILKSMDTLKCSNSYLKYQWFFNGNLDSTQTNSFLITDKTGYYKLQIEDSNGCTTISNSTYFKGIDKIQGIIKTSILSPLKNSKVYLIKFNSLDSTISAIDSTITDTSGNYSFKTSDSLVYIYAFPNSTYSTQIATYYDSAEVFDNAHQISLSAGINIINFSTLGGINTGGSGFIGGKVSLCSVCKKPGPAIGVIVLLKDGNGNVVKETKTDINGNFSFSNINVNQYKIWIDRPKFKNSIAPTIDLTNLNPKQSNLSFILYSHELILDSTSVTGINNNTESHNSLDVFPNPFNSIANINYTTNFSSDKISIELYNMKGGKIILYNLNIEGNKNYQFTLNAKDLGLANGFYVLRVISAKGIISTKVINYLN